MPFLSTSISFSFSQDWAYSLLLITQILCWSPTCRRCSVKNYLLWFQQSSQNSFCWSLVYYFRVFHYKWDLYCTVVPNQGKSSKPLVQNIFYKCLIHQINSIENSYSNLPRANTRQIFQGRLVYVLYFYFYWCFPHPSFLSLNLKGLKLYFCWSHRLFCLDPYIPYSSWENNQKQNSSY